MAIDTDGGDDSQEASCIDDFLERLVFGPDGAVFAGEDWRRRLVAAGIIE